jgi:hypothetical protein
MPLAFDSLSHGRIAFGFFNIETDMLLLEHCFFFADQFCESLTALAMTADPAACRTTWIVHAIQAPEQVGDLMGAIHGIRYTGFIGAVYQQFPFPERPADFKQKPDGHKNRDVVAQLIKRYAVKQSMPVAVDASARTVDIGDYRFSCAAFGDLVRYVWQGGYPQWQAGVRPDYVRQMRRAMRSSHLQLFSAIEF